MAEAMNVDALAAAGAAAGDEDLVHFLITNTGGKGLPSCRLTIPKNHLESTPSSYLSALSSRRWGGDDESSSGTAASPFTVAVDESPETIREIWSKYSQGSALLIPLIQKAYVSAGGGAPTPIVLPPTMELEDGVNFLKYYGIFPIGHGDMVTVPKDGPVAVYLRSQLYPAEASKVTKIKDALIKYLGDNPERVTHFVFAEYGDEIKWGNNNIQEGTLVLFRKETSEGRLLTDYVAGAAIRDKLVRSLREDKLEAEFMTKETPLFVQKLEKTPKGEREQQTLIVVKTEHPSDEDLISDSWTEEMEEDWYNRYYRILGWRYVLRVRIPDV